MAVKVGTSLWVMRADQQRPPVRDTQAMDFERRIGLHVHSPASSDSKSQQRPQQAISEQRLARADLAETTLARVEQVRSVGMSESTSAEALELYALGAHAGHHLSYLPDAFVEQQGMHSVASVDIEQASREHWSDLPITSAIFFMSSGAPPASPGRPGPEPVGIEQSDAENSTSRQLLSYLNGKWPDRHVQFLPRDKGVELLIRDYRLTSQERDELRDDLARLAPSMPERPQQIWLNGEQIWRASSLSNDYKGEHDGR